MKDVKLPITTVREGNKITKVCVEDVYKMLNRIIEKQNVTAESILLAMAHNINKLHRKIQTDRMGNYLFDLKHKLPYYFKILLRYFEAIFISILSYSLKCFIIIPIFLLTGSIS